MFLKAHYIFIILLSISACTSTQEIVDYQDKLRSGKPQAYASREEAFKAHSKNCREISREKETTLEINEKSPLLIEDTKRNIYSNFEILCFDKKAGESLILKGESEYRGGKVGVAHFLIPATTIFDSKGKTLPTKAASGRMIQPLWTGWRFATEQALPTEAAGKIYILVEADNRTGTETVGQGKHETYSGVGVIMVNGTADIKAYPTGTIHFKLEKNL